MLDLAALRKMAEAATPGPWTPPGTSWVQLYIDLGDGYEGEMKPEDTAFVAAFNPSVALELLDTIDRQQKQMQMMLNDERQEHRDHETWRADAVKYKAEVERLRAAIKAKPRCPPCDHGFYDD